MLQQPQLTVTELRYPLGYDDLYPIPEIDYVAYRPVRELTEPTADFFMLEDWELIYDSEHGQVYQRRES